MKTIPENLTVAQQTPLKDRSSCSKERSDLIEADVALVTDRQALDKLVKLYCFCIDKNLVVNVMSEMYVILEMLTVQEAVIGAETRRMQKEVEGIAAAAATTKW